MPCTGNNPFYLESEAERIILPRFTVLPKELWPFLFLIYTSTDLNPDGQESGYGMFGCKSLAQYNCKILFTFLRKRTYLFQEKKKYK